MNTKKSINLNKHIITIIKLVTLIIIIIVNLIILSPVYNNPSNTSFTIPSSPTVNTVLFTKLDSIIKNKKFYSISSKNYIVPPSLSNIFGQ